MTTLGITEWTTSHGMTEDDEFIKVTFSDGQEWLLTADDMVYGPNGEEVSVDELDMGPTGEPHLDAIAGQIGR